MIFNENKTKKERIADYVTLLKKWAHQKTGSIAYVWGGTSFISTINKPFSEVFQTKDVKTYSFYQHEDDISSPKNGFDCSGLITRATQICAIPYFCKNTTTIAHCLKPLAKETALSEGDLILIKGHVMVVSDIQKNLLIEARSYGHGYGKLHEIPLNKVFDGINNYQDLLEVYFNKKPIKRKDIQGMARDTFANVQLLSMESVWEKAF
jgi:cell wall-associated NlpC family hydrolase